MFPFLTYGSYLCVILLCVQWLMSSAGITSRVTSSFLKEDGPRVINEGQINEHYLFYSSQPLILNRRSVEQMSKYSLSSNADFPKTNNFLFNSYNIAQIYSLYMDNKDIIIVQYESPPEILPAEVEPQEELVPPVSKVVIFVIVLITLVPILGLVIYFFRKR